MATAENLLFLTLLIGSVIIFRAPLNSLLRFSLLGDNAYDKYSYTMAIPFISGALVFSQRRNIFANARWGFLPGAILLVAGLAFNLSPGLALQQIGADATLSLKILGLVVFWLGAFTLAYGTRALWIGRFPLLFLLLTVPLPDMLLEKPIIFVQYGSTGICALIFRLAGVPVIRKGLEFDLTNVSIIVARECSGIHSTIAIFIISLVAGYLFLSSAGKRLVLVLSALPIVCITNGLRIAGLTLLSNYVNPDFLAGNLHHEGGMVFFMLALVILFGILRALGGSKAASRKENQ